MVKGFMPTLASKIARRLLGEPLNRLAARIAELEVRLEYFERLGRPR